jgi:hypothetical protein
MEMFIKITFVCLLLVFFLCLIFFVGKKEKPTLQSFLLITCWGLCASFFFIGMDSNRGSINYISYFKSGDKFKIVTILGEKHCVIQKAKVNQMTLRLFVDSNSPPKLLEANTSEFTNGQFVIVLKDKSSGQIDLHPFPIVDTTNLAEKAR